jgi:sigma-B regulation protein RsbU (phosphoserine phosphatase)
MFPCSEFQTGEVTLKPGDLLALYSDGLTEAASKDGEDFGDVRLHDEIERRKGNTLAEIQAGVLEAVRKWAGDDLEDDMTLLMVRAVEAEEAKEK